MTIAGDEALEAQIGARTVSRIYEICGEAKTMFGEDHRTETFALPEPAAAGPAALREGWDAEPGGGWDDEQPAYGEPRPPRWRNAS